MGLFSSVASGSRKFLISGYLKAIEENFQVMHSRGLLTDFNYQVSRQLAEAYRDFEYKSENEILKTSTRNSAIGFGNKDKDIPAYTAILVTGVAAETVIKSRVQKKEGFIELFDELCQIVGYYPECENAGYEIQGWAEEIYSSLR